MLPGDLFGLPDAGLYVNSSETVCPASLYRVPWQQLRDMLLREPGMQVNLLVRVAFDLRQAQRRIVVLGQQNVAQRLCFVHFWTLFNTQISDDERLRQITLPLTRFDLADYLGTAPETVARAFAKLERVGLIHRVWRLALSGNTHMLPRYANWWATPQRTLPLRRCLCAYSFGPGPFRSSLRCHFFISKRKFCARAWYRDWRCITTANAV